MTWKKGRILDTRHSKVMSADRRILVNSTKFDANMVKFLLQEMELCHISLACHDFP